MERVHWTFLGAGNMAASLVGGALAAGARVEDIALIDPDEGARERVRGRFGVAAHAALADLPPPAEALPRGIVVAVKPDIVERACRAVAADARLAGDASPLVVSVAAGVRTDALESWLPKGGPVVRAMPNTPALLGLGATALYANVACDAAARARAEALLGAVGTTHWVTEEGALDAVTALSGSGPAYVFYLLEQMIDAGRALGLDADTAEALAIETVYGAASMAREREASPAELRERVTSKGGTTAAALAVLDREGVPATVARALEAARARAVELGDAHAPERAVDERS